MKNLLPITKYSGIPLKPPFYAEFEHHLRCLRIGVKSKYLNDEERKAYRVSFDEDGTFFVNGKIAQGTYLYIRLVSGELYAYPVMDKHKLNFHHSYLSEGREVSSAGYLYFDHLPSQFNPLNKGKLIAVSNESGHYMPTVVEMLSDLMFYLTVSKNLNLIFEDHSNIPTENRILIALVVDVLKAFNNEIKSLPVLIINDVDSNFGKVLNSDTHPNNPSFIDKAYKNDEDIISNPSDSSVSYYRYRLNYHNFFKCHYRNDEELLLHVSTPDTLKMINDM